MSKAIELAEKLDRQLTMSMFAKREDLYAQMAQDREDAAIVIKDLIAHLEAAQAELAAIRALEPALYQFRWLNPGCNPDADDAALQWKPVEPRNRLQTTQDAINELEAYRYGGVPCYEVRALVALPEQK